MALDVFPPEVADKLREFTSADLVVGIPTYNNAATIRHVRKPEPYKGKGIRYQGEQVRRLQGKTFTSGSGG